MTLPIPSPRPPAAHSFKRHFANRAQSFVKWADRLPGVRSILVGSLAGLLFTSISGAFGTWTMPWPTRLAFWALLIGINALLWIGWFQWRVKTPRDWWRAAIIGMIVLTLPLPLEILAALRLVAGVDASFAPQAWLHGLGIAVVLLAVAYAIHSLWPPPAPVMPVVQGRLFRHGVRDPTMLAAIEAEDHYCRLHFTDGRSTLIHARFAGLMAELGASDGVIVRRGLWLAARAAGPIERSGRRLLVTLPDRRQVAASASGRAAMRAAGWI